MRLWPQEPRKTILFNLKHPVLWPSAPISGAAWQTVPACDCHVLSASHGDFTHWLWTMLKRVTLVATPQLYFDRPAWTRMQLYSIPQWCFHFLAHLGRINANAVEAQYKTLSLARQEITHITVVPIHCSSHLRVMLRDLLTLALTLIDLERHWRQCSHVQSDFASVQFQK